MDGLFGGGGGGGSQRVCWPPSQIIGGGGLPPPPFLPTPMSSKVDHARMHDLARL